MGVRDSQLFYSKFTSVARGTVPHSNQIRTHTCGENKSSDNGANTIPHNTQPLDMTATQTDVIMKMKGHITRIHAPREREGFKYTKS